MSMDVEAGAGIELGEFSLRTLVGIEAGIHSLTQHLRDIAKIEAAYQRGVIENRIRQVQTSASSGSLVIGCGGPTYGRLWEVKHLTVGGVLWTTTVAGSAIVCVGPWTNNTTPPLTDIADQAATLPNVAYYSTRQLVVRHPDHLFVVILTPTASTQYAVGGQVSDFPDRRLVLETEN